MTKRWVVTTCIALTGLNAMAAGPAGHAIIAGRTIDGILNGSIPAPNELKQVLRTPEARRYYAGGAISPDLVEKQGHYGNTADLARQMLDDARNDMHMAAARKDEAAFAKARDELAFAYGWMNHMATDLNVHPKVNERTGDTFRYNDENGKRTHALAEAQLTAFIKSVVDKDKYPYDVAIAYDLLSKETGVSVEDLKAENKKLRAKAIGEIGVASKVTVTPELRATWLEVIRGTMKDNVEFMNNPNGIGNWDLDCGKISTADFDDLRRMAMEANNGHLPPNWGKMYMTWWEAVKNLPRNKRVAKLRELFHRKPIGDTETGTTTTGGVAPAHGMWVLIEMQGKDENQSPSTCKAKFSDTGFDADIEYNDSEGKHQKYTVNCHWSTPPGTLKPGTHFGTKGTNASWSVVSGPSSISRSPDGSIEFTVPDGIGSNASFDLTIDGTGVGGPHHRLVWSVRDYRYKFVPAGQRMPDPGKAKRTVTPAGS